ncbi:hypothetical protein [uncultured Clostridium sp.]|nr:hypothetical protein [uncultured Clostridium sp.]
MSSSLALINSTYIGNIVLSILPILVAGVIVGAGIKGIKLLFKK